MVWSSPPSKTLLSNVGFDGSDSLIIQQPGYYYMIGSLMPSSATIGPFGVQIVVNDTIPIGFGDNAANYGGVAGQEVVAFAIRQLNVGDTVQLYNIGAATTLGGNIGTTTDGPAARLIIYKIADL
ncbi:hypothetical protein BLX87_18755 [Bacillus sp. VT-16-64]|nr:hypothetical protein BLX87_18755 [Bacillus sp. VT-16-64]